MTNKSFINAIKVRDNQESFHKYQYDCLTLSAIHLFSFSWYFKRNASFHDRYFRSFLAFAQRSPLFQTSYPASVTGIYWGFPLSTPSELLSCLFFLWKKSEKIEGSFHRCFYWQHYQMLPTVAFKKICNHLAATRRLHIVSTCLNWC